MPTVKIFLTDNSNTLLSVREMKTTPRVGEIICVSAVDSPAHYRVKDVFHPENDDDPTMVTVILPENDKPPTTTSAPANTSPAEEAKKIFEHAKNYSNVICIAGYAGFFAIWNNVKDGMNKATSSHLAMYIGISLISFVLFEIIGMIGRALIISHGDIPNSKINKIGRFIETTQHRAWGFFLLLTIIPATMAIHELFMFVYKSLISLPSPN